MKNIKLLKGLLSTSIVLGCLSLATTTTSCGSKTETSDFVSFDNVQKELYGTYDEALGYTSVVEFDGFVLKDGFNVDDLIVDVENDDFDGIISAVITKTGDNTFKVQILFEADYTLYGKTTKFDLAFSHKSSKGHIQRLTGLTVEFVYYDLVIVKAGFDYEQKLVTAHNKISYITEGVFRAYNTYGESITDLSNFYVEGYCYTEGINASAQIVPLYQNYFVIQLNLDNIIEGDHYISYTIKNKKLPSWSKELYFKLTVSNKAEDAFRYVNDGSGVKISKCYLQDAVVSIPKTYNGKNVISIGSNAFSGCYNLKDLYIPRYVSTIGNQPFFGSYINKIFVDDNNETFTSKANNEECYCIMTRPVSNTEPTELLYGCADTKIPSTITTINEAAFAGCFGLEEVNLPDSVEWLGYVAFEACINLKKVNLNKVKTIATGSFVACISLNELNLGNQLKEIPKDAFNNCTSLTNLSIPANIESINPQAFYKCPYLEDISVAEDNQNYTSTADGKAINGIIETATTTLVLGGNKTTIPTSISKIGDYAFAYRLGISSLTIHENVKEIGAYAFSSCKYLEAINLGSKLTSIGQEAFHLCKNLKTIDIPASCETIGHGAFYSCGLQTVTLHEGLKNIGISAFRSCRITDISFPSTLETIGNGAFGANKYIEKVDLSKTKLTKINEDCFNACTQIKEVILPDTCTAIHQEAFNGCTSITSFKANNLTSIGECAFHRCGSMPSIDLSKVTTLDKGCFSECHGLQEINLSSLTNSIPEGAFANCDGLTKVTLPQTANITIGTKAFYDCSKLVTINLDKVTSISDNAFYRCVALETTNLSSATSIGDYAFINCVALKNVTLSSSLTSIGAQSFVGATALTSITIPASVTSIGAYAFYSSGITTATFEKTDGWKDIEGKDITLEAGASAANAKLLYTCIGWTRSA